MKVSRTMLLCGATLLISTGLVVAGVTTGVDCSSISERFFPQTLVDESKDYGAVEAVHQIDCLETTVSGEHFIIAGYSNGLSGAIRIIRMDADNVVVAETTDGLLLGADPQLSLVELNGDGIPEVVISLRSGKNITMQSIYRWNGRTLTDIGPEPPTNADGVSPDPTTFEFLDIDGDGEMEVLAFNSLTNSTDVYKMTANGTLGATGMATLFDREYVRCTGAPKSENGTFSSSRATGWLLIKNGFSISRDRSVKPVVSATIELNGRLVCGPDSFKAAGGFLRIPLHGLGSSNEISVSLRGDPKSGIRVCVLPSQD